MSVDNLVHKTSAKIFLGGLELHTSIISAVNLATKVKHGTSCMLHCMLFGLDTVVKWHGRRCLSLSPWCGVGQQTTFLIVTFV